MRMIIALAMLCAGCAGPFGLTGMNADQIKEWAKVKDANMTCLKIYYPGGTATAISISTDKGIPAGVSVDENCKTSFAADPKRP